MAKIASLLAATLAALCFCCSAALAQNGTSSRAWVSGHGADASGCGAPTNPCRSFQYVLDNIVAPSGEIDVLDPAGYGAVTISHAVSIINDGVGTAGVQQSQSGGYAIAINAGANDSVTLRGLDIDGLGVAQAGIFIGPFSAPAALGALTIENCVIRHFAGDGVYLNYGNGAAKFTILNTTASDNGENGFDLAGYANQSGLVNGSTALNNAAHGFSLFGENSNSYQVTVANSVASGNGSHGIYATGNFASAVLRNDVIVYNAGYGVYADGVGIVGLTNSEVDSNSSGAIFINSGATVSTTNDNVRFFGSAGTSPNKTQSKF